MSSAARPIHNHEICVKQSARIRALSDFMLITAFLAAIVLPAFQTTFELFPEYQNFENRALAARPEWPNRFAMWLGFPAQFEAYFNDHFGFRTRLIRLNNIARHQWHSSFR